jgi:hypothetical protein
MITVTALKDQELLLAVYFCIAYSLFHLVGFSDNIRFMSSRLLCITWTNVRVRLDGGKLYQNVRELSGEIECNDQE